MIKKIKISLIMNKLNFHQLPCWLYSEVAACFDTIACNISMKIRVGSAG